MFPRLKKWLIDLRTYTRKHNFDLENPKYFLHTGPFKWPVYECKQCGLTHCLDAWQIKDLPFPMSHGCTNVYESKQPTPDNPLPNGA